MKPVLQSIPKNLPAPPYPADTLTKGWRFELDLPRVWRSDTWVLCPADVRPWLYQVWAVAFESAPAGSLPSDHNLIAAHVGMEPRQFSANAEFLLRGFVLHSDGRLYHPVVVERVRALLDYRDSERERKAKYRNRLKNNQPCPTGQTQDSRGIPVGETLQEQEQEQEQEQDKKKEKITRARSTRFTPPTETEVDAYAREKNLRIDAGRFCDFYTSKGWRVGNASMKDWRAAVRNWCRNDKPKRQEAVL